MPRIRRSDFCRVWDVLEHFDLGDPDPFVPSEVEGRFCRAGVSRLRSTRAAVGRRIETGVEEGDEISPFYDPMIAKLIARGDDRDEAIAGLTDILDEVEVWPVKTNAGFLSARCSIRKISNRPVSTPG